MQFRVFRFRFVEEREVGVGVLPCGEEILVRDAGFGGIALLPINPAQFQLRGNHQDIWATCFHLKGLLEILLRFGETSGLQVGQAPAEEYGGVAAGVEGGGIFGIDGLGRVDFARIGGE